MTVSIDKWGRPLVTQLDGGDYEPYIVETTSGVTYTCYTDAASRIIWRETTSGNTTTKEFAYGPWADRATLTYAPINGALDVTI